MAAARRAVDGLLAGTQTVPAAALDLDLEIEDLPALNRRPRRGARRRGPGSSAVGDRRRGGAAGGRRARDAELDQRDTAWQELAALGREWLEGARGVAGAADMLKALKDAEKWLKEAAGDLRAERFAPIAEQAIANWRELRQGSSVDLHEITLKKVGRGGRADFDVRADGEGANALGVMSQGELLALSVSVFLPRAALAESPFRFAVIDDPVQAMDPAKVDGLASVLHRAARTRQLVVFTHDDRLPEAIRRLRLDATILRVDRRARSAVAVETSRSPVQPLPRRRAPLRAQGLAARRGAGARRPDVLPQRGRGRRGRHRAPPRRAGGRLARAGRRRAGARRARCGRRWRSRCSPTPGARARSASAARPDRRPRSSSRSTRASTRRSTRA